MIPLVGQLAPFVQNIPDATFKELLRVRLSAPAQRSICPPVLVNERNWPSLVISVG
jgi:hypothetical protein